MFVFQINEKWRTRLFRKGTTFVGLNRAELRREVNQDSNSRATNIPETIQTNKNTAAAARGKIGLNLVCGEGLKNAYPFTSFIRARPGFHVSSINSIHLDRFIIA